MSQFNEETVRERQSRVALSGSDWEKYVKDYLDEKLKNSGIKVNVGKYEEEIRQRSPNLWKMLRIPIKSTTKEYVWGDIDLVAIKNDIPIAVISCKTSLHGRFTETLFWSLLFRFLTKIKVVLVTSDTGSGKKGALKTEWGKPDEPNQNRLLAEAFLDGVYVENVPDFCKELIEPTVYGGIIRHLKELPDDIKRWAEEISKITYFKEET